MSKPELVDHPAHYNKGKYEHIEVVENWQMSPHMKDATKYLMRTTKGDLLQDTQKCRWYISRMIERPWTAHAVYPHQQIIKTMQIQDVARDWFPEKGDRYWVLWHLANAIFSTTMENTMLHLTEARDFLDNELKKLLESNDT